MTLRYLYRKLLAPPTRLLFRETQLEEAAEKLSRNESFTIKGPPGVGKTTLIKLATLGLRKVTYIPGYTCRTYECLKDRVNFNTLNVIDDYGLILRSSSVIKLVEKLPWKVVIIHPGLYSRELDHLATIWMPPYSFHEIKQILLERVERLALPVDTRVVEECSREAAEHSGSIKVALILLAERIT